MDDDDHFDLTRPEAPEGAPATPIIGLFARATAVNSVEFELLAQEMADPALGVHDNPMFVESEDADVPHVQSEPTLTDTIRNRISGIWRDRKALARSMGPNCNAGAYLLLAEQEDLGASADKLLSELRGMLRKLDSNGEMS
jgi:hypothetical protein